MFVRFQHCKLILFHPFPLEVTMSSPHLKSMELSSTSLRVEYLRKSSQFFCVAVLSMLSIYSFTQSLIYVSVCTHEYLFSTLGYNILLIFSNCSSFGHQELFHLALVSSWYTHIIIMRVCAWLCTSFLTIVLQNRPGTSCLQQILPLTALYVLSLLCTLSHYYDSTLFNQWKSLLGP